MSRIKITDLNINAGSLTEDELKRIKGGLLPYIEQDNSNKVLIGLLLPAVQKVGEAARR